MIDNIKIRLKEVRIDFSNNRKLELQGKSYNSEIYRLYNHEWKEKDVHLLLK